MILGIVLISCENNELKTIYIKKVEKKFIHIPKEIDFNGLAYSFQPRNKEYVYFLNNEKCILNKFDLLSFQFKKVFQFKKIDIHDFSINDSLKTLSIISNDSLYCFNFYGQLISKKRIPSTKEGYLFFMYRIFSHIQAGEGIYYFNFFANHENTYKDSLFFTKNIECCWDVNKNTITQLPVKYPHNYAENCFGYNFMPFRKKLRDKEHAYSFSYNDSLFIYNIATKVKKAYFLGTRRKKIFQSIKYKDVKQYNDKVFDELYFKNPQYLDIRILSNKKLIYRLFLPNNKKESKKIKKWHFILYNTNFEYLGETPLIDYGLTLFDTKKSIYEFNYLNNKLICTKLLFSF